MGAAAKGTKARQKKVKTCPLRKKVKLDYFLPQQNEVSLSSLTGLAWFVSLHASKLEQA